MQLRGTTGGCINEVVALIGSIVHCLSVFTPLHNHYDAMVVIMTITVTVMMTMMMMTMMMMMMMIFYGVVLCVCGVALHC